MIATEMNAAWTVDVILNMIVEKNAVMILTALQMIVAQQVGDVDPLTIVKETRIA
jgi:hypothetical protein